MPSEALIGKKRMRLLICAVARFTQPSGVCRFASNLAQCLAPHAEVHLAIGEWQKNYFSKDFGLSDTNVRLWPVEIPNQSVARNRWMMSGLGELAGQIEADVVHLGYPMPVRRRGGLPYVGTVHDLYPFDAPENFGFPRYLLNQAAFRKFIRNADGVTCVSRETLKRLEQLFARDCVRLKPVVAYNTVSPASTSDRPAAFKSSSPFLLAVAQHRTNKNLARLIDAFTLVRPDLPADSILALVGTDGPETAALHEKINELKLRDSVCFLAGLGDEELRWIYENALALVSPSLHEGFGLPPIEAEQYGCPSVVSDIPIFREVAPAHTQFVDPLRVESIAEGIRNAVGGTRPTPETPNSFRPETVASIYLELYGRLLSAKR